MNTLDIDAVLAFVLTADLTSFTRAAEALNTRQSAVSLRVQRLEATLGKRLLDRTPRSVRLSQEGAFFLPVARALVNAHTNAITAFETKRTRLVVGISHHVVGPQLPIVLRHLHTTFPGLEMEVRVAMSRDILDAFDEGTVDAAIVIRNERRRRGGEVIYEEVFGWAGAPDFAYHVGDPLPLAAQAAPCSVRSMALSALAQAGIAWKEVFVGGGIPTVGAAVSAGLAVAALGRHVTPVDTVDVGARLQLPPLPSRDVMLYLNAAGRKARDCINALVAAIRSVP